MENRLIIKNLDTDNEVEMLKLIMKYTDEPPRDIIIKNVDLLSVGIVINTRTPNYNMWVTIRFRQCGNTLANRFGAHTGKCIWNGYKE